jgi:hypothetical protein
MLVTSGFSVMLYTDITGVNVTIVQLHPNRYFEVLYYTKICFDYIVRG